MPTARPTRRALIAGVAAASVLAPLTAVATSAILAVGYNPQACDPSSSSCETKGGAFIAGSVYLGVLAVPLGGVIGLLTRTDRWMKLPPEAWTSRVSLSVPNAQTASVHITFWTNGVFVHADCD